MRLIQSIDLDFEKAYNMRNLVLFLGFFMFDAPSMEQRHKEMNQKYNKAREALVNYKNNASALYKAPLETFIKELDAIHAQKNLPQSALIKAFEQTEGLMKGTVSAAEYHRTIHEMKNGPQASKDPSRLSNAMEILSWAVWVISVAFLFTPGYQLVAMLGIFLSAAIHADAQHNDVKYPNNTANTRLDLTPIVEQMQKVQDLDDCGAPMHG